MNVRELVRETLESLDEPDPHAIAQRLSSQVTNDQADELVIFGLIEVVKAEMRMLRDRQLSGPMVSSVQGPSRWETASKARVPTADGWKFLEDCTVVDLDALADKYAERAAEQQARSDEFRHFARLLEASGCDTFGQMVVKAGVPEIESLAA